MSMTIDQLKASVEAVIDQYASSQSDIKIRGKSIAEIDLILRGLELERAIDIEVTMSNLDKLFMALREDDRISNQRAIHSAITGVLARGGDE